MTSLSSQPLPSDLTVFERMILDLALRGMGKPEIRDVLELEDRTVRRRLSRASQRCRAQVVRILQGKSTVETEFGAELCPTPDLLRKQRLHVARRHDRTSRTSLPRAVARWVMTHLALCPDCCTMANTIGREIRVDGSPTFRSDAILAGWLQRYERGVYKANFHPRLWAEFDRQYLGHIEDSQLLGVATQLLADSEHRHLRQLPVSPVDFDFVMRVIDYLRNGKERPVAKESRGHMLTLLEWGRQHGAETRFLVTPKSDLHMPSCFIDESGGVTSFTIEYCSSAPTSIAFHKASPAAERQFDKNWEVAIDPWDPWKRPTAFHHVPLESLQKELDKREDLPRKMLDYLNERIEESRKLEQTPGPRKSGE